MGIIRTYYYEAQWVTEGSVWRVPDPPIILRDEAGAPIASSQMASMLMTLYDLSGAGQAIVNGVDGTVDVKNARSCTLSTTGVFVLVLLPADTVMLDAARPYEVRRLLVQYAWPLVATKSDCLEVTFIVRNILKRP